MADFSEQDSQDPRTTPGQTVDCEQWAALLVDKLDGTLAPDSEAAFAQHVSGCRTCTELLEQARQGQQWLKLLEENVPAAPVDLLSRILAQTQGQGREGDYVVGTSALSVAGGVAGVAGHAGQGGRWGIPFLPPAAMGPGRSAHNARLLMTAAMAFFSVALTLSVAGVRLTQVHAAELRPQAVQANMTRSFYGTKKQVVSFYDNLRLVYEVESKMREFRRDADADEPSPAQAPASRTAAPAASAPATGPATAPAPDAGTPGTRTPKVHATPNRGGHDASSYQPGKEQQIWHGAPLLVDLPVARRHSQRTVFVAAPRCQPDFIVNDSGFATGRELTEAMSKERNRT